MHIIIPHIEHSLTPIMKYCLDIRFLCIFGGWRIFSFLIKRPCKLIFLFHKVLYSRFHKMGRRKSGLEATAFEPPFYEPTIGPFSYNIPDEYESVLIDIYTKYTSITPDITIDQINGILHDEFNVPIEILPSNDELEKWVIEGTNILDFEKWLYYGHFWMILSENIDDVDILWNDLWGNLGVVTEGKNIRERKLYLAEITKLNKIGKLDANAIGMLQTAGNGKLFITYIDFFILLGRLGILNTSR